jgi:prenyltransferase beta subunit
MKSARIAVPLLVMILFLLTIPPPCFTFSENSLINYIQSRQVWEPSDEYSGFRNSEIENSSVKSTALAFLSLSQLNIKNQTIYDGSLLYISGCEQVNGGFASDSKSNTPSLRPSYWAVSALNSINSLDWVNLDPINWIAERQLLNISEPWNYGGFENKVNTSSANVEYSFYGVSALHQLSGL